MAGRYLLPAEMVRVFGRPAFHDTTLAGEVAFLGGAFPFVADISVAEILAGRPRVDPRRRAHLIDVLEVDRGWRMHQVSDGQRRRVQILLDLERSVRLVLLDEVTADLDILARADLLRFLRRESDDRGVTTVYATHVLDGLAGLGDPPDVPGTAGPALLRRDRRRAGAGRDAASPACPPPRGCTACASAGCVRTAAGLLK